MAYMDFYQKSIDGKDYILVVDNTNRGKCSVYIFDISGMKIQHVVDRVLDSENFKRIIGNVSFYINRVNGIYNKEISTKFPPIYVNKPTGRLSRLTYPDYKLGTLDLETYRHENKSFVYALGFYVDKRSNVFYLDKNLDSDELIFQSLNALLLYKYNGYTFYVHNLGGFDIYFILPVLDRLNKKIWKHI